MPSNKQLFDSSINSDLFKDSFKKMKELMLQKTGEPSGFLFSSEFIPEEGSIPSCIAKSDNKSIFAMRSNPANRLSNNYYYYEQIGYVIIDDQYVGRYGKPKDGVYNELYIPRPEDSLANIKHMCIHAEKDGKYFDGDPRRIEDIDEMTEILWPQFFVLPNFIFSIMDDKQKILYYLFQHYIEPFFTDPWKIDYKQYALLILESLDNKIKQEKEPIPVYVADDIYNTIKVSKLRAEGKDKEENYAEKRLQYPGNRRHDSSHREEESEGRSWVIRNIKERTQHILYRSDMFRGNV